MRAMAFSWGSTKRRLVIPVVGVLLCAASLSLVGTGTAVAQGPACAGQTGTVRTTVTTFAQLRDEMQSSGGATMCIITLGADIGAANVQQSIQVNRRARVWGGLHTLRSVYFNVRESGFAVRRVVFEHTATAESFTHPAVRIGPDVTGALIRDNQFLNYTKTGSGIIKLDSSASGARWRRNFIERNEFTNWGDTTSLSKGIQIGDPRGLVVNGGANTNWNPSRALGPTIVRHNIFTAAADVGTTDESSLALPLQIYNPSVIENNCIVGGGEGISTKGSYNTVVGNTVTEIKNLTGALNMRDGDSNVFAYNEVRDSRAGFEIWSGAGTFMALNYFADMKREDPEDDDSAAGRLGQISWGAQEGSRVWTRVVGIENRPIHNGERVDHLEGDESYWLAPRMSVIARNRFVGSNAGEKVRISSNPNDSVRSQDLMPENIWVYFNFDQTDDTEGTSGGDRQILEGSTIAATSWTREDKPAASEPVFDILDTATRNWTINQLQDSRYTPSAAWLDRPPPFANNPLLGFSEPGGTNRRSAVPSACS